MGAALEYLMDLREYHRNGKRKATVKLKEGEVVLVKEDNVKRNSWKMGKVEELIIGNDKVIRGAKLRVVTNGKPVYLSRPVQKLYPLEVVGEQERLLVGDSNEGKNDGAQTSRGVRTTPRRAAAIDADRKTRAMLHTQL